MHLQRVSRISLSRLTRVSRTAPPRALVPPSQRPTVAGACPEPVEGPIPDIKCRRSSPRARAHPPASQQLASSHKSHFTPNAPPRPLNSFVPRHKISQPPVPRSPFPDPAPSCLATESHSPSPTRANPADRRPHPPPFACSPKPAHAEIAYNRAAARSIWRSK